MSRTTGRVPIYKQAKKRTKIIFPITPLKYWLKSETRRKVTKSAPVYLAAVLDYICAELIDVAGSEAVKRRHRYIESRHILIAKETDVELNELMNGVTIPNAGVRPNILPELLPKIDVPKLNTKIKTGSQNGRNGWIDSLSDEEEDEDKMNGCAE